MTRESVLVVDDERDILELVKYNLDKEGYQVTVVETGEDALAATRTKMPDVVVLDLMLPGVDGLEVCRRLKSDLKTRGIPIVIVGAAARRDTAVAVYAGASCTTLNTLGDFDDNWMDGSSNQEDYLAPTPIYRAGDVYVRVRMGSFFGDGFGTLYYLSITLE